MTQIRLTCADGDGVNPLSGCGDIVVTAPSCVITHAVGRTALTVMCPACNRRCYKVLDTDQAAALIRAGVRQHQVTNAIPSQRPGSGSLGGVAESAALLGADNVEALLGADVVADIYGDLDR